MFKISLKNFAAAGKSIHRNILKPMARPMARNTPAPAPGPAGYYQDRRAAGPQAPAGRPESRMAGLFQAPKPTVPTAPKTPPPAAGVPASPFSRLTSGPAPFAGPGAPFVVSPRQLAQVREQTLQRARGFAAPSPGIAPGDGRRKNLAAELGLSRPDGTAAAQPRRAPNASPAFTTAARPVPAAARPPAAIHAQALPQGAQPALPSRAPAPSPWGRPLVAPTPKPTPAPERRQGPLKAAFGRVQQAFQTPPKPTPAPKSLRGPVQAETPRTPVQQGPLLAAEGVKSKHGQDAQRVRTLITAEGVTIQYDKSHVQGGFGRFHRARLADGTLRGLKQVRLPENGKEGPRKSMARTTPIESVEKEAAQMRALGMEVYGVHRTSKGKAFIETELFAGSLMEKLQLVPINARVGVARHSLGAMLKQLTALHADGSVHRDIKNDNLLFNAQGRIQIADPGLLISKQEIAASKETKISGTRCYMPPENFTAPPPKPGPGVDTWAAGCAYLQQLTHKWPLLHVNREETAASLEDFEQTRKAYLEGKPLPKGTWGQFLIHAHAVDPEGTRFALTHLMARNPRRRSNAATAAAALKRTPYRGRAIDADIIARSAARGLSAAAGPQGV